MKPKLYSEEALDEIIGIATQSKTEAQWIELSLKNIADVLQRRPIEYRTFGTFWWPLKAMLVKAGLWIGSRDAEFEQSCSAGSDARNLAGALAYHEFCTRNFINSNFVSVTDENGELDEFVLADDEMEMLASLGQV